VVDQVNKVYRERLEKWQKILGSGAMRGQDKVNVHRNCELPRRVVVSKPVSSQEVRMGVSRRQTARNRQSIIDAAARLFRERGVDGVGLNELMREAGFTQGGFYNHFKSKEALVAEVMATAMTASGARLFEMAGKPLEPQHSNRFARQIKFYLSKGHRDDMETSCAVACLASDARRMGKAGQARYAQGLHATLNQLASIVETDLTLRASEEPPRERAIALYAQMVGALVLSRAVESADRALADEILTAARDDLLRAVGDDSPEAAQSDGDTPGRKRSNRN
jgi:TetR/AcrR family transcriptional regulator, transcriptional repressor for nem operon